MTTYNGRSAQYIPGKEVPNKEPPVSRYVVEKLYRVHRERVLKVEPTIDSHVKIPDFLTNQTWKKNAEKQKQIVVMRENQDIYGRIAKVENAESLITKANKVHVKRVEAKLSYLRKLKEHGRLVSLVKIQKENELLLKRLEKAKPQYTLKKCKLWYKHHELYKAGRRTDPTAGHIMYGMKGLLPLGLPPLSSTLTDSFDKSDSITTFSKGKLQSKTLSSLDDNFPRSIQTGNSILSSNGSESLLDQRSNSSLAESSGVIQKKTYSKVNSNISNRRRSPSLTESEASLNLDPVDSLNGEDSPRSFHVNELEQDIMDHDLISEAGNRSEFTVESSAEDMMLVSSRPFPIPFESKNCLVQVYVPRNYDENLRLRAVTSGVNAQILAERLLPIDKAYDIINAAGQSSQIVHSTENADLHELSTLLINMFKEADEDGSGSLTFDQFQTLMEQVDLGISPQELRFVICEADENENGVVDYEEFVPLAVDLIRSFRARNRAKTLSSQEEVMVDDKILQTISSSELQHATDKCMEKIHEFDSKHYGLIRVPDLKRCLGSVAGTVGLSDAEISMLCQMLPRDQFGRLKYNATSTTFFDTLSKVRFITMKNTMIETQGSGLQKYLLDLCKEEERRLAAYMDENTSTTNSATAVTEKDVSKFVPSGILQCRSLINILNNSPRLSLSRLQVLVIMSEASVLDGMINYFQFIPVVTKAIEIMFEPKALRERAELIEKTDLSPEALLQGMSSEMFEQRLLTLFKSYDIDHNGTLDQNEFIACLESLELQLTYGEMLALMAAADVAQHGFLKFEDFVGFFTHNLLNLEREKHIRLLQNSLHHKTAEVAVDSLYSRNSAPQDTASQLLAIFKLYDLEHTGKIPFEEFENILQNLMTNVSKFLIDVLLSELQVTDEGFIEYEKAIGTCTELFKVYQAQETFLEETKQREQELEAKAVKIVQGLTEEVNQIVKFLMKKMKQINEASSLDLIARFQEMKDAVRSSHSGLSRNEANIVLTSLFMGISYDKLQTLKSPSEDDYTKADPVEVKSTNNRSRPTVVSSSENFLSVDVSMPASRQYKVPTPKFRISMKSFKLQFSSQELFDVICDAKKTTVMRSMMQQMDSNFVSKMLLSQLQEELTRKQERQEIPLDSTYLPIQVCYNVISKVEELRLNRAQIMYIISLADCYDKDGKNLEIHRFAELASNIASELHHSDMLQTRSEILSNSNLDDRKTFHGMRERELFDELHSKFQSYINERHRQPDDHITEFRKVVSHKSMAAVEEVDNEDDKSMTSLTASHTPTIHSQHSSTTGLIENIVTLDEIRQILKNLTKLKLNDREINTILVGLEVPNEHQILWIDIIQPIIESIRVLNREHLIQRRVSLAVTSMSMQGNGYGSSDHSYAGSSQDTSKRLHEESIRVLKQLSDKLLNFVKIVTHGDGNIHIQFPKEQANSILRRTTSQLLANKDDILLNITADSIDHHEIISLFRGAMFIKTMKITSIASDPKLKKNSFSQNSSSVPTLQQAQSSSASRITAHNNNNSRPSSSPMGRHHKVTTNMHSMESIQESRLPVFLQILAIEDTRLYSGCSLVANLVSIDGNFHACESLQVKLPSIGLVDREAAQQFAANLAERMFVESRSENDYQPKLCMYE